MASPRVLGPVESALDAGFYLTYSQAPVGRVQNSLPDPSLREEVNFRAGDSIAKAPRISLRRRSTLSGDSLQVSSKTANPVNS